MPDLIRHPATRRPPGQETLSAQGLGRAGYRIRSGMTGWGERASCLTPHQSPAREKLAGGLGHWHVRNNPDSWGAGERPGVVWRMWLGAVTRAPPVRDTRHLPGAGGLPSCVRVNAVPDGFVLFGRTASRTRPCPIRSRPRYRSAMIRPCQDRRLGTPPVLARTSRSPVPANAGVPIRKLPACGHGPRTPKLTASRRPELRQPRLSVWNGRSGECGTAGKGG
jgi:hypothetical protein